MPRNVVNRRRSKKRRSSRKSKAPSKSSVASNKDAESKNLEIDEVDESKDEDEDDEVVEKPTPSLKLGAGKRKLRRRRNSKKEKPEKTPDPLLDDDGDDDTDEPLPTKVDAKKSAHQSKVSKVKNDSKVTKVIKTAKDSKARKCSKATRRSLRNKPISIVATDDDETGGDQPLIDSDLDSTEHKVSSLKPRKNARKGKLEKASVTSKAKKGSRVGDHNDNSDDSVTDQVARSGIARLSKKAKKKKTESRDIIDLEESDESQKDAEASRSRSERHSKKKTATTRKISTGKGKQQKNRKSLYKSDNGSSDVDKDGSSDVDKDGSSDVDKDGSSYDELDDSPHSDDSGSSPPERSPPNRKRPPPKKRQIQTNARRARAAVSTSDDDDDQDGLSDSSDNPPKRQVQARARASSLKNKDDDDDDQDTSSDSADKTPSRTLRSLPKWNRSTRSTSNHKDGRRSTPTRVSAARTKQKLAESSDSEDLKIMSPKKRKSSSSDEEFVEGEEDYDNNDELESDLEEEESTENEQDTQKAKLRPKSSRLKSRIQKVVGIVGTPDSSSGDEIIDKTPPRKKKNPKEAASSDSLNDDTTTDEEKSVGSKPKRDLHVCLSETDAITLDPLPSMHVCCVAPDGQSRQCFALETLHKVALSSSIVTFRHTFDGKQNFLQPPHFRTTMSDDLLDQIASRFGREALDLHGEFYQRSSNEDIPSDSASHEYLVHYTETLMDDEAFVETFRRFVSSNMGSQDVYVCPLCYNEAHRQLNGDDDKPSETKSFLAFEHDPMMILGFLDNDRFAMASTFCFFKVAEVKRHLREDHGVEIQKVDGNELYSRFKVRGQGGLLQSYINKMVRRSRQGDMMRYWMSGNNQSFLLLLSQIKVREVYWQMLFDDDDDQNSNDGSNPVDSVPRENANALWDEACALFESFSERAEQVWDALSAPFRKVTQEEVEDFIADDNSGDDEEVDPTVYHRLVMKEQEEDFEKDIIEHLKRKRLQYDSSGDDDDEDKNNDGDDSSNVLEDSDSEKRPAVLPGYYSEVSEEDEEDEWIKRQKQKMPGRRRKNETLVISKPPAKKSKRLGRAKRLRNGTPSKKNVNTPLALNITGDSDSDDDEVVILQVGETSNLKGIHPSSATKSKRVIVESDDGF